MFHGIHKNVPKFVPNLGAEPGILNLPVGTVSACINSLILASRPDQGRALPPAQPGKPKAGFPLRSWKPRR